MRLTSTTETPAALRRGLSDQWRTPPPEPDEEDFEGSGGNEAEESTAPKKYARGTTSKYPDYHDVMKKSDRAGHMVPPAAAKAIQAMPLSDQAHLAYHLGTHPKHLARLHKLSPAAQVARVHELLAQIKQRQEPGPSVPNEMLETAEPRTYNAIRDAQEQARRRRR
jgi:hypothetical protein